MRIRIALGTAAAVIALPAIFFAVFTNSSAASARLTRHEVTSPQHGVKIDLKLMSYAEAENVAKMTTYTNAVERGQEETDLIELGQVKTYLTEVAYLKVVAAAQRQQAAAAAAAAPAAASRTGASRRRAACGSRHSRHRFGCDECQHGRLGLHPSARVQRQLRRGERRRVPVRVRDVERADRTALTRRGLPARRAGRGRTQAVLPARLGALDHPLRLRALTTEP